VTGPFVVEATIPTVLDPESTDSQTTADEQAGDFIDRLLEVLRRSPVLRLEGNRSVTVKNLRRPAKTLSLSAEGAIANGKDRLVAFLFGPENGAVVEKLVWEAAREAKAKNYDHLYVIGFAIQPSARQLVESCEDVTGIAATYVQATPDLMMGDLLKNMRSSQIFSVCGLPEIDLRKVKRPDHLPSPQPSPGGRGSGEAWFQVELLGLDVFDPGTMEAHHKRGDDVPAWFLDTDYNALSFHVCQAFFPRTAAWDNLKRALKGEYEDSVWGHLAKNVSVPFEAGEHGQIAVKVIDDRGNELMVVRSLKEAK
jgi:adenine-specific DNA-methyltransferase